MPEPSNPPPPLTVKPGPVQHLFTGYYGAAKIPEYRRDGHYTTLTAKQFHHERFTMGYCLWESADEPTRRCHRPFGHDDDHSEFARPADAHQVCGVGNAHEGHMDLEDPRRPAGRWCRGVTQEEANASWERHRDHTEEEAERCVCGHGTLSSMFHLRPCPLAYTGSDEEPPPPPPEPGALTAAELELLDDITKVVNGFGKIIGDGPTREADIAEVVAHIHVLQNAVLAQAAARAYPLHFRLMGESFHG